MNEYQKILNRAKSLNLNFDQTYFLIMGDYMTGRDEIENIDELVLELRKVHLKEMLDYQSFMDLCSMFIDQYSLNVE
jgi:hypothetical protein